MIHKNFRTNRHRSKTAFSLVEVALALGIVSFGLVCVLGTLPVAVNSGHESIVQTRASQLASSVFSSFRAQAFNKVCYLDVQLDGTYGVTPSGDGPPPIDLQVAQTGVLPNQTDSQGRVISYDEKVSFSQGTPYNSDNKYLRYYATILDNDSVATTQVDASKVKYILDPPSSGYQIILHFTSAPDGVSGSGLMNRIDVLISSLDQPATYYRFSSTVTNRNGNINLGLL